MRQPLIESTHFQTITDRAEIRTVMHAHMLKPKEQRAPFIVEIFSREHHAPGWFYEGARVIGSCTSETETVYTILIDEMREALKLSLIEHIKVLR